MNQHTAVEIDGGWRYATLSRRGGGPLGYCSDHEPHATELEARECYSRYQRDNLTLDGRLSRWTDCEVCGGPAKNTAGIRGDAYAGASLCDEHLTAEHAVSVLGLNQPAGDSWQS